MPPDSQGRRSVTLMSPEQSPPATAAQLVARGAALFEERRFEEALAQFERAVAADPGHAPAHFWRGKTCCEIDRYDEAIAALDEALRLEPNHGEAHYWHGLSW